MAKERGVGLLKNLDFCPEYREDGGQTQPIEQGRFKYFAAVARRRNGPLLIANLMFLIFLLPAIAIFVLMEAFGGVEEVAYKLIGEARPYLLSGIGFAQGASQVSALDVKMQMLNVYYLIFAAAGFAAFVMSIGLGGMTHLSSKFILDDSFESKTDNYGNKVPKGIKEFFKGVKRTWKESCIVGAILLVLIAGVGNLFVYFVGKFWQNQANAGHWIMVILAGIFAIFALMFLAHFIPQIALANTTTAGKMKNAFIFTLQFALQTFGLVVVISIPFILISTMSLIISVIIIAILLVYGSKWYSLILCNYEQYLFEKIINPVYSAKFSKQPKKKKK